MSPQRDKPLPRAASEPPSARRGEHLPERCAASAVLDLFVRALGDAGEAFKERAPAPVSELLRSPDGEPYVSHALLVALIEDALRLTGDESLGLLAARCSEPGDLGLVELIARSCSTVGEAVAHVAHYLPLLLEVECAFASRGSDTTLRIAFTDDLPVLPALYEFLLAQVFMVTTRTASHEHALLSAVELAHREPRHLSAHDQVFGVRPVFGAAANALTFSSRALSQALPGADPLVLAYLKARADEALARLPRARPLRKQVCEEIREHLAFGGSLRAHVARKLGMSPSTLRRRLAEQGTSFTQLHDELRRTTARELLSSRSTDAQSIARQLGFSHASAFQRACRRWYGVAPGDLRRLLSPDLPSA